MPTLGGEAMTLTQARYEQIIADGATDSRDFYTGAMGCITFAVNGPETTVDEIRTIVAAMHAARDRWLDQRQAERAAVLAGVDGWPIEGRAR